MALRPTGPTFASGQSALHDALDKALSPSFQSGLAVEAQRASKRVRQWSLALPGGVSGALRRPEWADAHGLAPLFERTPTGMDPSPSDTTSVVERVKELLWQSASVGEDAFILSGLGEVLGFAAIDRSLEVCEQALDVAWLATHGLAAEDVCISRMALTGELRGHGLGHHLKQAQKIAAGDAGYLAVASLSGNPLGRALAARAGGLVQTAAVSGWVLVPTLQWEGPAKPARH